MTPARLSSTVGLAEPGKTSSKPGRRLQSAAKLAEGMEAMILIASLRLRRHMRAARRAWYSVRAVLRPSDAKQPGPSDPAVFTNARDAGAVWYRSDPRWCGAPGLRRDVGGEVKR
jgi:hypothetical protein